VAAALVIYWAALCIGTHVPGGYVGTSLVSDKTLHFFAYTGLSFLLAAMLSLLGIRDSRVYLTALLIAIGYGAIDELGQIPIPSRTADGMDWLADVAGAAAGVMCWRLMVGAMTLRLFSVSGQKKPSPP
jgi:VanZ family protein